jgi:methionine biosynthesis protein MetW
MASHCSGGLGARRRRLSHEAGLVVTDSGGKREAVPDQIATYYERYWTDERELINIAPAGGEKLGRLNELVTAESEVLDFGCGDGVTVGTWLAAHAARYVGVDISSAAITEARALGLDVRLLPADGRLPFADASFDLVTCLEVLEHMFDPQSALVELRRVLRPEGAIVVTVPNVAYWRRRADLFVLGRWNPVGDSLSAVQPWRDPHLRFFTRAALTRLLERGGFEDVVVGGQGGGILAELPVLRALGRDDASRIYRRLRRSFPGLLAGRLEAVARVR